MKIFFILPTLKAGGAERVLSFLSQNLTSDKYVAELIVIGFQKDIVYNVSKVNVRYLNKSRVLFGILPLIKILQKEKPAIAMSSIGHINLLIGFIALFTAKTKFIAREASVASVMSNYSKKKSFLPSWIVKFLYNNIDAIICQSKDMAADTIKVYGVKERKIHVINNPAPVNLPIKDITKKNPKLKIITIGRLSPEKGHLRLLEILSKFEKPFEYTIIGEGPLKAEIFRYIAELRIDENIHHIPFTEEIGEYLIKHDLFLQGSYVEGFPNSLLESCMCGLPAIAFNAPGGTKEIIIEGVNGHLVDSSDELLKKLNEFSINDWNSKNIRNSVYEKFNKDIIVSQYENLFQKLLNS